MTKNTSKRQYAVCVDNTEYEVSLERGKLYEVLPDPDGAEHGLLRVVDESGEDYLYNVERFFPITVPPKLAKVLQVPPANKSLHRTRPRALANARPLRARG